MPVLSISGIYIIPFMIVSAGWLGSLLLSVLIFAVIQYTLFLLNEVANSYDHAFRSYAELAKTVMNDQRWYGVTNGLIILQICSVCISYIYVFNLFFNEFVCSLDYTLLCHNRCCSFALSLIIIVPFSLQKTIAEFKKASIVGHCFLFLGYLTVMYNCIETLASEKRQPLDLVN